MENTKILTVANVRGYEKDGTVYLNIEDVARGLGFTKTEEKASPTCGRKIYESIRWERINGYLKEFGFSQQVGKDDFIPENIFYRLAMKAKNEVAEKFQILVADEILPQIRKTGSYSAKPKTSAELFLESAKILYLHEKQLEVLKQNQEDQNQRIKKIEQTINPTNLLVPVKKNYMQILGKVHRLVKEFNVTHAQVWEKLEVDLKEKFGLDIQKELEKTKESYKQYYFNKCKEFGGAKFVPKNVKRPFEIETLSVNKIISAKPEWYGLALKILDSIEQREKKTWQQQTKKVSRNIMG